VHILAITSSGLANIELFWGAEGRKYVKSVDWISPETPRTIKKNPSEMGNFTACKLDFSWRNKVALAEIMSY